jgi:hypothetical protein
MLGWPASSTLAHGGHWEYSYQRLKLAQLLSQLDVFLTPADGGVSRSPVVIATAVGCRDAVRGWGAVPTCPTACSAPRSAPTCRWSRSQACARPGASPRPRPPPRGPASRRGPRHHSASPHDRLYRVNAVPRRSIHHSPECLRHDGDRTTDGESLCVAASGSAVVGPPPPPPPPPP